MLLHKVRHPVSFSVAHPSLRRAWDDLSRFSFFFPCPEMVSHVTGSAEGLDSSRFVVLPSQDLLLLSMHVEGVWQGGARY